MELSVLSGKKILVVEDNSINQMLVRYTLSKSGALIDIADNGSLALLQIKDHTYDVILMDIHMPELDGYQTTQIIRNELHLNIPIIAMTALAIKGEETKCIGLGMNGYVSKPFTTESLCGELIRVLKMPSILLQDSMQLTNESVHIDLSFLHELAGEDRAYEKTMIQMFIENMPVTIQKIQTAINNEDWNKLYKIVHYLKSSLSVIKINVLFELCVLLEKVVTVDKDPLKAVNLIKQIETLYAKAEILLRKDLIYVAKERQVA